VPSSTVVRGPQKVITLSTKVVASRTVLALSLVRMCFNDYDREIALIGVRNASEAKEDEIIGVGRLIKMHAINNAEFAVVVSDQWQGHGLGTRFLKLLLDIGRQEGVEHIIGKILPANHAMQRLCRKLGFVLSYDEFEELIEAKIRL
jgi:acetyltransferase